MWIIEPRNYEVVARRILGVKIQLQSSWYGNSYTKKVIDLGYMIKSCLGNQI